MFAKMSPRSSVSFFQAVNHAVRSAFAPFKGVGSSKERKETRARFETLENRQLFSATGLSFNLTYEPSVTSLPIAASVEQACQYVANEYTNLFSNPITINIDTFATTNTGLGESFTSGGLFSYSQIRSTLASNATSPTETRALASLPASDPTNGKSIYVPIAQERALGLRGASDTALDGRFAFNPNQPYSFDPNNRAVRGKYDFIGIVEHEFSEVMGRGSALNSGNAQILDLFRYKSAGSRSLRATDANVYFSTDAGSTKLMGFNSDPRGDISDWAGTTSDAYNAFSSTGVKNGFSSADFTVLDALGYHPYRDLRNAQFRLDSSGNLMIFRSNGWSVFDTNVTSYTVQTLSGVTQVYDLHSDGTVYNSVDGINRVIQDTGVQSLAGGVFNGGPSIVDLDKNGLLKYSHGTGWQPIASNIRSFAYDSLGGTNYLVNLNGVGVLSISHGTGWSTLDTGVTSFVVANLNGLNQVFDLHSDGQIFNTIDGRNLVPQGAGATSIAVDTLAGTNYLFNLSSAGVLSISHGTGWSTLDTGVTSFVVANLNGLNQVFDLHSNGQIFNTIDGRNLVAQGTGASSIAVDNLGGTNFLFNLSSAGVLSISHGTGWSTLDTGVTSFVVANLNGLNQVFDLHSNGQVFNTINGRNLVAQGAGATSIAVDNLAGTNYLFDLTSAGTLLISHGTGWSTLDTGVTSFVVANMNGLDQVFDLHGNGQIFNTIDGHQFVFQGNNSRLIAVENLGGTNCLFELSNDGTLFISHGTGWTFLDRGVTSFVVSSLSGLNQMFDLHSNGQVFNTIDGNHLQFQDSSIVSLAVGTLRGTNYLVDLDTNGVLKDSVGTGWRIEDTGVIDYEFILVGSDHYLHVDGVFGSFRTQVLA